MDAAAVAAAAQTPSRPAEWLARPLERALRRLPRGTPRNARTALSGVEKSIVGGLHPEAPDEAIRETRLGTALDSPLCDGGGETACYAHLLCPECGAVLDGGAHASGCSGKA